MIEEKTYTYDELCKEMECNTRQTLQKKLVRHGIEFTVEGKRAPNLVYTINYIPNPFMEYCITKLGFHPQTSFP